MTTLAASLNTAASFAPAPATATSAPTAPSRKALWAGRVLGGLAVLFLTFDATVKLLQLPVAIEGTVRLGYAPGVVFGLGVLQAILLVAYLVPRTSVLGALLWTAYLGGAVATHVRVADPIATHILTPVYVAAIIWASLWLRNPRVRGLFSAR